MNIEITPVGAPRMTQRDRWTDTDKGKGRPAVLNYFHYRDQLRAALPDFRLPAHLELTFYLPMPKSWSKRARLAKLGAPHDQKPDIDNLCKAFMDAFKSEDKHVFSIRAEKRWSDVGAVQVGGRS